MTWAQAFHDVGLALIVAGALLIFFWIVIKNM